MIGPSPTTLRFTKMHGAGNDFVVVDCRDGTVLSQALAARLADRRFGIGCDQVLTVHPPRSPDAVLEYGIWNTDGSAARQCGNGARCIAAWARRSGLVHGDALLMDSPSGPVRAELLASGEIAIELPAPDFTPTQIPLLEPAEQDSYAVDIDGTALTFGAVSMGNPHAVIEVDDVQAAAVARIGARLQADPRFPHSCNVGFAEVVGRQHIRLRVYERGVGETLACGSGACAAVAVLTRRGRVFGDVVVDLPGGRLHVNAPGSGQPVLMRGPAVFVFEGDFHP